MRRTFKSICLAGGRWNLKIKLIDVRGRDLFFRCGIAPFGRFLDCCNHSYHPSSHSMDLHPLAPILGALQVLCPSVSEALYSEKPRWRERAAAPG